MSDKNYTRSILTTINMTTDEGEVCLRYHWLTLERMGYSLEEWNELTEEEKDEAVGETISSKLYFRRESS